jgi:predicted Zn-dependent peptidase
MNSYEKIMMSHSNARLIEIVTVLKDEYQPEAVQAAISELKRRNLTKSEIESAKNELIQNQMEETTRKNKSISWYWKILLAILPASFRSTALEVINEIRH